MNLHHKTSVLHVRDKWRSLIEILAKMQAALHQVQASQQKTREGVGGGGVWGTVSERSRPLPQAAKAGLAVLHWVVLHIQIHKTYRGKCVLACSIVCWSHMLAVWYIYLEAKVVDALHLYQPTTRMNLGALSIDLRRDPLAHLFTSTMSWHQHPVLAH